MLVLAESSILVLFEDLPRENAGPGDTSFMTPGIEQIAPETIKFVRATHISYLEPLRVVIIYMFGEFWYRIFNNPILRIQFTPSAQDIANGALY